MIEIKLSEYSDYKENVLTKNLKHFDYIVNNRCRLIAIDGPIYYTHRLNSKKEADYEENLKATSNEKVGDEVVIAPFAIKGSNQFKGAGIKSVAVRGVESSLEYAIPEGVYKFNGIEVLGGQLGDDVDLQVIDDASGTYSETPNSILSQSSTNWNVSPGMRKSIPYGATLYVGMIIKLLYRNNGTEDKAIYINYDLHKTD